MLPRERVQLRHRLLKRIRSFFYGHDFCEVDTSVRLPTPCMEDYIDAIPSVDHWLRSSPELQMKRLLAADSGKIFQIGPCFRDGEYGKRHRPEFTMLEWYMPDADYRDIRDFTVRLFQNLKTDFPELPDEAETLRVSDAFERWADVTALDAADFDEELVQHIEPQLGRNKLTFLMDYPADQAALSRLRPDDPRFCERWELYINGLELANAYSELTDPEEQLARFKTSAAKRKADGRPVYELDQKFLNALADMPPSAGCALGIERLLMIITGTDRIDEVLLLSEL